MLKSEQDSSASKSDIKKNERVAFLESCLKRTVEIQNSLVDPYATRGHPNPDGLGDAEMFSRRGSWGQSSVLFPDLATYYAVHESGESPYGGAEYGIPQTPEADDVCKKISKLHSGKGAIICPSGLSAITTTIDAFAPHALIIPDNVYTPLLRYQKLEKIPSFCYPGEASADEVAAVLKQAYAASFAPRDILMYIEAPGSGTFEIPDIDGIVALAKANGIRTVMDNTWASHVRFKPLERGVDIVIQATTKYEGGYGDTPSGVVIAGNAGDFEILSKRLRAAGNGAVAPTTCARLFWRIDSTEARMNQHNDSALQLVKWFLEQDFVADVLSPALEASPHYERFKHYFGKGNGLFSVVFKDDISSEKIESFVNSLNLFWVAQSWGGHVSLVLPVTTWHRKSSAFPQGKIMRFHAGLEDPSDLLRDLNQAAQAAFNNQPRVLQTPSNRFLKIDGG